MSKTLHITETGPEPPAATNASGLRLDQFGAILAVESVCTDVYGVSSNTATLSSLVEQQLSPPAERRWSGVRVEPFVASEDGTGTSECAALARRGLRCAFLGMDARDRTLDFRPGAPFLMIAGGDDRVHPRRLSHFELAAADAQEAADFAAIGHAVAELSLCPGILRLRHPSGESEFESLDLMPTEQMYDLLGDPEDEIECPTAYQVDVFGTTRRRIPRSIPEGLNPRSLLHDVPDLVEVVFDRFAHLTGRRYGLVRQSSADSSVALVAHGGEVVHGRRAVLSVAGGESLDLLSVSLVRPFPAVHVAAAVQGKKAVIVVGRNSGGIVPVKRRLRNALDRAVANASTEEGSALPYPEYPVIPSTESPVVYSWNPEMDVSMSDLASLVEEITGRPYASALALPSSDEDLSPTSRLTVLVRSASAYARARSLAQDGSVLSHSDVVVTGSPGDNLAWVTFGEHLTQTLNEFNGTDDREADRKASVLFVPGAGRRGLVDDLDLVSEFGVVVVESKLERPHEMWQSLPGACRAKIRSRGLRLLSITLPTSLPTQAQDGDVFSGQRALISILKTVANEQTTGGNHGVSARFGTNGNNEVELGVDGQSNAYIEVDWAEFDETETDLFAEERRLRLEDVGEATAATAGPEDGDRVARRLNAFHFGGIDVGEQLEDSGLVPVQLYPYLEAPTIRGPYPMCVSGSGEQFVKSLTDAIDDVLAASSGADEENGDVIPLLKLDAEIRRLLRDDYAPDASPTLADLWDPAVGRVVASTSGDPSVREAVEARLKSARTTLDMDAEVLSFGREAVVRVLQKAVLLEWEQRLGPVRDDAEGLAIMMDEFLRADFSESAEGRAPDHLEQSVGKSYADELNFDALADMVKQSGVAARLSDGHRTRLRRLAADLRELPKKLAPVFLSRGATEALRDDDHVDEGGLADAVALTRENMRVLAMLVRSMRIAHLEAAGRYHEVEHDAFFSYFGVDHLSDAERALCPPCVVDLGMAHRLAASDRSALLDVLTDALPIKVLVTADRIVGQLGGVGRSNHNADRARRLATEALGAGTAFVLQTPASELSLLTTGSTAAAQFNGPAFVSVYMGSRTTVAGLDPYLASAIALESRAVPAFRYDPSGGTGWADRFTIQINPAYDKPWASEEISFGDETDARPSRAVGFTFGDYLACDARFGGHFRAVGPALWHESMMPLEDVLAADDKDVVDRIPYVLMTDERAVVRRVIVSRPVVEAARRSLATWRTLQELGGVNNSYVQQIVASERSRLDDEKRQALAEAEADFAAQLDRTTGDLARDIVSNIAAGLLGLRGSAGGAVVAPIRTEPEGQLETAVDQDVVETAPSSQQAAEAPVVEDDDISLDDPYIETPRCTTCNECTNINSRMFAYDQNNQAYIKDASAGTFRELVDAAEKCPVRIIHPGKPLDPDESDLNELLARAQPFV